MSVRSLQERMGTIQELLMLIPKADAEYAAEPAKNHSWPEERENAIRVIHENEAAIGLPIVQFDDLPRLIPTVPPKQTTRAECLREAERCVCGKREQDYGSPENNFNTIALLWGVYLRSAHKELNMAINAITATDVSMLMALLKVARIATGTGTADSFADLAGYAACGCEIATKGEQ